MLDATSVFTVPRERTPQANAVVLRNEGMRNFLRMIRPRCMPSTGSEYPYFRSAYDRMKRTQKKNISKITGGYELMPPCQCEMTQYTGSPTSSFSAAS